MKQIGITLVIAIVLALAVISSHATKAADTPTAPSKVRIGVYDSRAIALAWGRSKAAMKELSDRRAEYKKAKAEGKERVVNDIEEEMKVRQDKMHWQVFGDWNIDDVLAKIRPNYPAIAQKAGVVAIVPRVEFKDTSVETVDVTELMAEQFAPDDKTRALMKDVASKPPLAFEEMRKVRTED